MKRNRGMSGRYPRMSYSLSFGFLSKTGLLGLQPSMLNVINSPRAIFNISHHFEAGRKAGQDKPVADLLTYTLGWQIQDSLVSEKREQFIG